MSNWEYASVKLVHATSDDSWSADLPSGRVVGYTRILDQLGRTGWELVAVTPQGPENEIHVATFKRPL